MAYRSLIKAVVLKIVGYIYIPPHSIVFGDTHAPWLLLGGGFDIIALYVTMNVKQGRLPASTVVVGPTSTASDFASPCSMCEKYPLYVAVACSAEARTMTGINH